METTYLVSPPEQGVNSKLSVVVPDPPRWFFCSAFHLRNAKCLRGMKTQHMGTQLEDE